MPHPIKKITLGAAAIAALAFGGSAAASAASSTTTTAPGSSTTHTAPAFNGPAPGTVAHENAEKAVTGTDAAKAQAAAVKSVGSGTAGAVTTNYTGNGYEVTVTKADGTKVEVHLDSSFTVMQGPGGMGMGGHGTMPSGTPPPGAPSA